MREWTTWGAPGGHIAPTRNLENPLLITTCHSLRPLTSPMTDPLDLEFHQVHVYMYPHDLSLIYMCLTVLGVFHFVWVI